MMYNELRKPGEFCWINMLSAEPVKAKEFFGKLLGWTYDDIPGMGYMIKVGGKQVGGLFDLNGPNTPKGTPPTIGVMVKVTSADAMVKKVNELGGKAQPAFDIMENGRMAVCHDPHGANFDLWEAKNQPGMDVDPMAIGAPSWFETLTNDTDKAGRFYTSLFGWTMDQKPSTMPDVKYTMFKLGQKEVAGMMKMTPAMGKMPSHWAVYFTVKDADASSKEAVKLGGKICVPVMDIPNVGKLSGITSPQGVHFYIIQYKLS